MFISLRWKATLAVSLLLAFLCGVFFYFIDQRASHVDANERAYMQRKHVDLLNGLLEQSEAHLAQVSSGIPEALKSSPDLSIQQVIDRYWLYLQADWNIEGISLYKNTKSSHSWGDNPVLPAEILQSAMSGDYSQSIISCSSHCTQSMLVPFIQPSGPILIQINVQLNQLLNDFRKITKSDIGLIAQHSKAAKKNIPIWGKSVLHLTNEQKNLSHIIRLSQLTPFSEVTGTSQKLTANSRTFEISIFKTPHFLNEKTNFVILTDITHRDLQIKAAEKHSLGQIIIPLLAGCVALFLTMILPLNRIIRQTKIMRTLIKGEYELASSLLKKQKPRRFFADEVDQLLEAEGELSNQLDQLQMQLQESTDELKNLAMFDNLTGLANRYCFLKEIKLRQRRYKRNQTGFALLFLDLDNFKRINDSLGHSAGDKLLGIVSNRLKSCVRAADVVGRLGGDEFCILIDTVKDPSETHSLASHILSTLIMPIHISGTEINISASIGIVVAPNDGITTEELLQNADLAMYQAKAMGRNKYCPFSKDLTLRAARQLSLENELRSALANREFVLYFQPQVHIHNSEICGMETLIRWNHPSKGMQYPDQFIDTLEETGLIVPVGEWILKESCRLVAGWLQAGLPPIKVAVNISARQFTDPGFLRSVEKTLAATGLPTEHLELEITESMVMGNMEESFELLQKLRDLGVTLSIDDFGTGYSSLSYLKSLPVDILKVDRSFVMDIPSSQSDMEITAAIIAMAHKLQLKVVAEGIENPEQHQFLNQNGCDYGQGYLFAKPLTQKELIELLNAQRQQRENDSLTVPA
ncbi:MAG: EAL domain-containing protein [Cellvibrionaceae bacterium]|nr:EAL domain-containing protein [Cellvibrionaceae bacterium]